MGWLSPMNTPMREWRGRKVWLIGASSGIGLALAQALHAQGARVCVSARQATLLNDFVQSHPGSEALPLDVTDTQAMKSATARWQAAGESLDCVVYCAGHYRAESATAFDWASMQTHLNVNYTGALSMLDAVLPMLLAQGHGHVCLVSSVAGFRGLPKSLAYGPTKAALTHLAEILFIELPPRGVDVSVVHPGFVATPLTAQNTFHMPALITPAQAAQAILQGWRDGEFNIHFPKRFTRWLQLLRLLPYRWYFAVARRLTA